MIEIQGSWDLPNATTELDLENLQLNLQRTKAKEVYSTQCTRQGELTLQWGKAPDPSITLDIEADHPGPNEGWDFSGDLTVTGLTIASLITHLGTAFGISSVPVPTALNDISLTQATAHFNTKTRDFSCSVTGTFEKSVVAEVDLKVLHQTEAGKPSLTTDASGKLTFNNTGGDAGLVFDLIFDKTSKANTFAGAYVGNGVKIKLSEILRALGVDLSTPDIVFEPKQALFGYNSTDSKSIIAVDLGGDIDLSSLGNLPIIGSLLGHFEQFKMLFHVIYAHGSWSTAELDALNPLLHDKPSHFPADKTLSTGLHCQIQLTMGSERPITINFGSGGADTARALPADGDSHYVPTSIGNASNPAVHPPTTQTHNNSTQWQRVGKSFGPLHISRLGLKLNHEEIALQLDAAINAEAFDVNLMGLKASIPLTGSTHIPSFSLNGLGIDIDKGPLQLGGALFINTDPHSIKVNGETVTIDAEYDGMVSAQFESLALGAVGAFAQLHGDDWPSLFVFAYLDFPLGGPPFFFITGLAGGLGFNRYIKMPKLNNVGNYWLVELATGQSIPGLPISGSAGNASSPDKIAATMAGVEVDVPPMPGEYWLAAGLQFTTFELLTTFVTVMAQLGKRFEFDVIGELTISLPSVPDETDPPDALVVVQLALKGSVIPSEGVAVVSGQLTKKSYLLSSDCHLSGGFAYGAWIEQGDFLMTMGGYAPMFHPPSYYPTVPHLGINWKISDLLSVTGGMYYALTPHVFMVGGYLSAVFQDGGFGPLEQVKASFDVGADFLISWKPFHDAADAYISIDLDMKIWFFGTHHIDMGADADLKLWGPPFGGHAHIGVHIIGLHVSFNISFGDHPVGKPPILWSDTQSSFLPASKTQDGNHDNYLSATVTEGISSKIDHESTTYFVVNPKRFTISVQSVLPTTALDSGSSWADSDVANPDMLQSESLRLFQVDPMWLCHLIDGALSVGRVLDPSTAINQTERDHIWSAAFRKLDSATQERVDSWPRYGFLLRSHVVEGWPHLHVLGYSDVHNEDQEYSDGFEPIRKEALGKDILLCLFDQPVQTIDLFEVPETIHFGLTVSGTKPNFSYSKVYRNASSGLEELSHSVPVTLPTDGGKLDLHHILHGLAAFEAHSANTTQPWWVDLQMIEGVQKVRILPNH